MTCKKILAVAMAATALGACNSGATNEAANGVTNAAASNGAATPANAVTEAAKPDSAPTANAASDAGAGSSTLNRAYMVGRWGDDGDCSTATEFRADGTFLFPWGDTGQWTLQGDQLTLTGNTSPFTIRVIDRDTLERTASGGTPRRVTRCT